MNLGKAKATNFQSYPSLAFDYSGLGLALVTGITGSGKSTLLDLPAWTLFGITSKDSAADDVRAWGSESETTTGEIEVHTPQGSLTVFRVRGKSSHQNDFYWIEHLAPDTKRRGKDANDTLKLLQERIGVTSELYLAGAYMHQFSTAEQFFIAKAKDRREALEKIADLSLPVRIAERASEERKVSKKELELANQAKARAEAKLDQLGQNLKDNSRDTTDWYATRDRKLAALEQSSASYEAEKAARVDKAIEALATLERQAVDPRDFDRRSEELKRQLKQFEQVKTELKTASKKLAETNADIRTKKNEYDRFSETLGETCPTCLGPATNGNRETHVAELAAALTALVDEQIAAESHVEQLELALKAEPKISRSYQDIVLRKSENQRLIDRAESERAKLKVLRAEKNTFAEQMERLKSETNPFEARHAQIEASIVKGKQDYEATERLVSDLEHRVSSLTTLYDKSFEFRGKLIEQAVRELNDTTNEYLEKYFEASLRVRFTVEDGDKIDVTVLNNGYECPYKQLSGGERTLLKLCFNLPYMKMSENRAGVKFGCLMFDEPLKGLSDGLKDKAFTLLQAMEKDYDSILLIEHYEPFKSMFLNQFHILNNGGQSEVVRVFNDDSQAA